MSELERPGGRRPRADAARNVRAILDAATTLLGERPDASMDAVAAAAGVSRQTVYAHFPTRAELVGAVVDALSGHALAAIDAVDLDRGDALDALVRLVEASWATFDRFPVLLHGSDAPGGRERHEPVVERLTRLIRRGRRAGEISADQPVSWQVAAVIALGHATGEEVGAGRLPAGKAPGILRAALTRLLAPVSSGVPSGPSVRNRQGKARVMPTDGRIAMPTGLGKPALRALAGAGYTRLDQLAEVSEKDLGKLHGMGPKALRILREALAANGLSFRD
ncbi:MAG TPA: TetR family transcriptional regulator [Streptosporangiales bacterium]